ncbi:MAG: molybdate ABC transporter substrate-binding protein [Opitutaceae bacterium]
MISRRLLAAATGFFLPALTAASAEITVYAAASLSDAMEEIAQAYEARSSDSVRFNFGASSMLARQIREGAPADIFFSADEAKMDNLASAGLIAADTRRSLLSNSLVIVVGIEDSPPIAAPADLAKAAVRRIALAETQSVPAGIYARAYLEKLGLWERVAQKVVPLQNVRAALAAVESGNADAGIVYKTDALISEKVGIVFEVPISDGPAISYPAAVLKDSKQAEAAGRFIKFLVSPAAGSIFTKHGFPPAR